MSKPVRRTLCAQCGAYGPPGEYHPYAFCLMFRASDEQTARANLNAVVAYGRSLAKKMPKQKKARKP